ncbi:MAG: ammonium transporter [Nitrospiraceae bacterium]|nr:ammonium transporter [Nitrospiraceae bacterium]
MWLISLGLIAAMVFSFALPSLAAGDGDSNDIHSVLEVQKYTRSIHIMAMLLAGFGFLMVFVRGYGRSALTATFLMVSVAIPVYMAIKDTGIFGISADVMNKFILSEFAAAGLLIAAGAVLGRLKMYQYILLGILFVPFYMFNEWVLLEGGLGLINAGSIVDTGGSIVIHAFGAIFGVGVATALTMKKDIDVPVESDYMSERFSMLGSMILWIFWPSFCAALVPVEQVPQTVVNVVLALSGSTLATYFASVYLRGKMSVADVANASLAGGVAIGSTCVYASTYEAMAIGVLAGLLSTFGFAVIQPRLQRKLAMVDTCGVSNLHGFPGLMGGLAALFVVTGISIQSQILGIVLMSAIGAVAGIFTGKILSLTGRKETLYEDKGEFLEAE